MAQRLLSICGVIAPMPFVFVAILGGAMRSGYSHRSDTVSELFSPGSPNKSVLDILHTIFALLLVLFGIGVLRFVRGVKGGGKAGIAGAWLLIGMGLLSVLTATVFPQDAWGSPPTFPGQMHQNVSGPLSLLTLLAMLLIGIWAERVNLFPGLRTHSLVTIGASVLPAGFFAANWGSPIMGLAERISALVGFQWTFALSARLFAATRTFHTTPNRGEE